MKQFKTISQNKADIEIGYKQPDLNNPKERAANYMRLKSGYDQRFNYKPSKIIALELYFIFSYGVSVAAVAYKLGFNKAQLDRIVNEWQNNNGYLIVESKINLDIKK